MQRIRLLVFGLLVIGIAAAGGSRLAAQDTGVESPTGAWFVELNDSVDAFRRQANAAGLTFSERFVFGRLWRGVSINANETSASAMRRLPAVRAVFPVLTASIPPVEDASPELSYATATTGAAAAHAAGHTGAGVRVGIIDTGVDYHHPDLGGAFGPGARVVAGYDFVGDRYDAAGAGGALIPHPDADPDDCNSHGTHVAGIVGASGDPAAAGARGVAPGVTLGAYRVFGCEGSTSADIMVAAMERALADGMDVVNMSIGAAFQTWPQYPTAVAADALVDAGVVVVTSIGNSGANGVYSASAPGVGHKVIGTASFDNTHAPLPFFTVSPDDMAFGYTQATAAPAAPTSGTFPLVRTGSPTSAADACGTTNPFAAGSLAGKIALIRRGTCGFHEKSRNAQDAGAVGVVLYNNVPGLLSPTVAGSPAITIPVVAVGAAEGTELSGRLPAAMTSSIDLTWQEGTRIFANATANRASAFSSYGLTAELQLKPDIGAPGGFITSTVPLEQGAYGILSGTSMASPHVAGAAALLLEANPYLSPAMVRTILQNSADPMLFGTAATTALESTHRQGAGMLDIVDALAADTVVSPGKLSLGEGTGGTRELSITNGGGVPRTYSLGHNPGALTFGSTFAPSTNTNPAFAASVVFSRLGAAVSSVTVQPGETMSLDVTITAPALVNGAIFNGFLRVTDTAVGGKTYRVPYAGFWGDYQLIQVLAPGGCVFPGVFKVGGETTGCPPAAAGGPAVTLPGFTRQSDAASYNVEDRTDRPVVLYHRAHQSRRLEIRALDVATNVSHLVAYADYVGRSATNGVSLTQGGFSTYTWDGKALFTNAAGRERRRELPAGLYRLQLVVTKALAQDGNPAHVERWTSPVLTIVR